MPDPATESHASRAVAAVQGLLGPNHESYPVPLVEHVALQLLNLPDESFTELCAAVNTIAEHRLAPAVHDVEPLAAANRVLSALDRKPKLLNSLILRLLERGDIAEHIAFLVQALDVKVAAPWADRREDINEDELSWWVRKRHHYDHTKAIMVAEVVTVEGDVGDRAYDWNVGVLDQNMTQPYEVLESGTAPTIHDARVAADRALKTRGWILL